MSVTLTGTGGYFTRSGAIIGEYNRVAALYGSAATTGFNAIWRSSPPRIRRRFPTSRMPSPPIGCQASRTNPRFKPTDRLPRSSKSRTTLRSFRPRSSSRSSS